MKIGSLDISSFKVGGADCSIYLGDVKLYPSVQPTTWTLVDNYFLNPSKIKVQYSLIDQDDSEYSMIDTNRTQWDILYIGQDIVDYIMDIYDIDMSDYLDMVGLFQGDLDHFSSVLEDNVEYNISSITGGVAIQEIGTTTSSPYLYAQ